MWLARLFQKIPATTRVIVLTCLCGIVGAMVAVGFQRAVAFVYDLLWTPLEGASLLSFACWSFVILLSVGLISGAMLAGWAPEAAGSGIPQLKLAYWRDMGAMPIRAVVVKFVAGTLTIGGGMSLGREGPTVQMSAGLTSWVAAKLGMIKLQRRDASACGAAAGLAAAFNTPIAAVTFVLEEIIEDLNNRAIGRILLASVVAVFFLYLFTGNEPAFHIPGVTSFNWLVYLLTLPVGAGAAMTGVTFQKLSLGWRRHIRARALLPVWARPAVGAIITWAAACLAYATCGRTGVLGLGYADLGLGLAGHLTLGTVIILLLAKLIATVGSYAWGGCGGIFAPTLFLGAMTGCVLAESMVLLGHLPAENVTVLAVVGMSACLGAVVRAPITSIIIVFEMTHDFALVPPLMLGAIVSQAVSRWLCHENFYTQVLHDDGNDMGDHVEIRDFASWRARSVGFYATFEPRLVTQWEAAHVSALLAETTFGVYPALKADGSLDGVVRRADLEKFLATGTPPAIETATTVTAKAKLGEVEKLLIEANLHLVILIEPSRRAVIGLFTLHDLLRSQVNAVGME